MMRTSTLAIAGMTLVLLMGIPTPGSAQQQGEVRLGGGSDIAADTTIRLPQGGSIPPIHQIFADNPDDEPIRVEFRAVTPAGITVEPEWDEETVPAGGNVQNRFAVKVGPNVAPGEYPVIVQLVRADISAEPGRITNIPAIQTAFTVEVTGDAAQITVSTVSAFTGSPVPGIITLAARSADGQWFELNRGEGTILESRVAPGEYRAAVLLGDQEMASEELTVGADQAAEVILEVETVSFVLTAVRPVEERARVVIAELVAGVNNETGLISGPASLQARVIHDGTEIETVTLLELPELPAGITEASFIYRPTDGWQPGAYAFVFELVTPEFTLVASDQDGIDVPALASFDLLGLLAALDVREAIALGAAVLLAIVLIAQFIRVLARWRRRRREAAAGGRTAPPVRPKPNRIRRPSRWRSRRLRHPKESWLEERIGPTTAQRSTWEESEEGIETPDTFPAIESPAISPTSTIAARGSHQVAPDRVGNHELAPPAVSPGRTPLPVAANGGDMASMVEALRVIEQLQDQGTLAPEWSITDATLIYWAIISPRIQEALDSVGMTESEYVIAMRRLLSHGLLGAEAKADA